MNDKNLYNNFRDNGIITIEKLIDVETIKDIKQKLSINFKNIDNVSSMDLHNSGILKFIFKDKIRYLINLIMPDGILWHCHYLKTPCNQPVPHFNPSTRYGAWHRDRIQDYNHERIDYLDIMIYLNDVGERDGAFAFLPVRPDRDVDKEKKSSKIIGSAGLGILSRIDWWHSATPNIGNFDREMIRISFAKNMYHQGIQLSQDYVNLRNYYKDKDDFLNFIFGGNRAWTKNVKQPIQEEIDNIIYDIPPLNYNFSKSYKNILKNKIRNLINF
tara:strand:- start:270 stop:1085 length:816 start_codon:yes stop_codon:yes gene_type:complete